MTTPNPPKLLTKQDACERLSISRATLDRIIARGELQVIHVGRQVRIHPDDLSTYIDGLRGQ